MISVLEVEERLTLIDTNEGDIISPASRHQHGFLVGYVAGIRPGHDVAKFAGCKWSENYNLVEQMHWLPKLTSSRPAIDT